MYKRQPLGPVTIGTSSGTAIGGDSLIMGSYTFTVFPSTNDVEIYKVNEDVDYSNILKSYRFQSLQHEYDKQNARRDHQYEAKLQRRKDRDNSFFLDNSYRFGRGGAYDFDRTEDPGSVEISNVQLGPGDHNYEREPISKVRESILRLEIEELKKNK